MKTLFVINPGSTSTVCSLFEDEKEVKREKLSHSQEELKQYKNSLEQLGFRFKIIEDLLNKWDVKKIDAAVGRGGPFKPIVSGTYTVNETMLNDVKEGRVLAEHISNIGPLLASKVANKFNVPAFTVDPVSVDEFEPLARVAGIPEVTRVALQHTLNIKAMARKAASQLGKSLDAINLIVAHLGGGISICPLKSGKIIDANNANEGGPFSPERSGSLPVTQLVKLCFSGKYDEKWIKKRLVGNGGITAHLGTNSIEEVRDRIANGDEKAKFYIEAMAYQIAKEIGAMATVLKGKVDGIVLTGSAANYKLLVDLIKERTEFIAPALVLPGENEMLALAQGALRVLNVEETAKQYL
ncbi:MAG: butyrate kinase [bacterium]